jgi:phosphatidylinositol alpha-mannosyltransferase
MKIALVSPYDYTVPGGVAKHIFYLDKHLRRLGHEVKILAPCSGGEALEEHVISVSGNVISFPFSGSKARITLSPRIYRRVKKILQQEGFDIVHIHEPAAPALPLIVLRHSKSVNVGTFHAYRDSSAGYRYGKRIFKPIFAKLDGKIVVSEAVRDYISRYFPGEYVVIPNGIDLERFGAQIEPFAKYATGGPNILFVGRLEKRKGFKYLLDAFTYVKEEFPGARLLVVGAYDKEDKAPYVHFVRRNRIRGVRFIGYVSDEELPRYYKSCDLFCAPSTGFESFGMVLLEAMASGVAIVASDIAGYRTALKNEVEGLLVEPENEIALAQAIIRLLKEPEVRRKMGERGRERAEGYSWVKVTQQLLDYYRELLARKEKVVV